MELLLAAFFGAHALIHAAYLAPGPPRTAGGPEWPFVMDRSWLVTALGTEPSAVRPLGTALVILAIALFVTAALATTGWLVAASWWPSLAVGGAAASLATLILFFHPWLVVGIAIDTALLWLVLVAQWLPAART